MRKYSKTTVGLLTLFLLIIYVLAIAGCSSSGSAVEEDAASAATAAPQPTTSDDQDETEEEHTDEEHVDEEHTDEEHAAEHEEEAHEHEHESEADMLMLPELAAADLNGRPLQVIATTSVIGDIVGRIGGEAIQLTTLIPSGQDSHSYEPATRDMAAAAEADVVFINGWNLEERLVNNLETIAEGIPVVPVSANITPLEADEHAHEHETEAAEDDHQDDDHQDDTEAGEEEHEHSHGGIDPHTWFSIHLVEQWVENIEHVLSELDPSNAELFANNAAAYLEQLAELEAYTEAQLATIPAEQRVLVTNHDSFGYFARDYDFELLGTVLPGISTLAEPSASDLAGLVEVMREHGVCTIFTETSASDALAQTVASELDSCEQVQVLSLYTESIGPVGSGADSYIGMFRANVDTIVQGLQ